MEQRVRAWRCLRKHWQKLVSWMKMWNVVCVFYFWVCLWFMVVGQKHYCRQRWLRGYRLTCYTWMFLCGFDVSACVVVKSVFLGARWGKRLSCSHRVCFCVSSWAAARQPDKDRTSNVEVCICASLSVQDVNTQKSPNACVLSLCPPQPAGLW